ncbi:acyl-CoA synthetase [Paraburkholderia strydomiana]|jgi:fatty-acyl-CoA synthase|uniref:acyl-CoA synthetase n=1 Tax=Paraburkholderia strydomiana TaxID=1245417 RepID=UPI002862DB39|nr:acyl-CoA synthetase [Paraburkholderia strydomiana]MDR7009990.1 fatty-acyl-CoA synthase [Paraburkholderia strydomiana]
MAFKTLFDVLQAESIPLADRGLPTSTYEAIGRSALAHPNAAALTFFVDGRKFEKAQCWTYAQFFADVTRTANALHHLGVRSDDVVAFVLPNLPETHFTIWGGEAAGIVMAINPLLDGAQITALLSAARPRVLVTLAPTPGTDIWLKLAAHLEELPTLRDIVWVNLAPYLNLVEALALHVIAARERVRHKALRIHDFRALMRRQSADGLTSKRQLQEGDTASYFCTGGTTGLPKIAVRSHGAEVFNAWAMAAHMEFRESVKTLFCGLPLFHANAQMVTGLMAFMHGHHVILGTPQGYRGECVLSNFWAIVEHYRINFFSGVPTVYAALLKHPVGARDISTLEFAVCGAAPLPTGLMREFERRMNIRILEGYGLTEGTCVASCNPPDGDRIPGSIGIRLCYQGMRVCVLDNHGGYVRDAELNEAGAILITGPNVFKGYLEDIHNTGIWVTIGGTRWLNTGDLGREDEHGYFWLTGRKRELIIRGGHNIEPRLIEEPLETHPAIALAAAVGAPDSYLGEVPVAYVQLKPEHNVTAEELQSFAESVIHERAAVPQRIEIIDSMPLTAVGKIFKPALIKKEIERTITEEANAVGIASISIELIDDRCRGVVARIKADEAQPEFADRLACYSFQIDWR